MAADPAETFRQEAQDLFEQLEQALLDLEAHPDDMELIGTAFRALHTLKGSGAMFGFDALSHFAHQLEAAFDLLRHGTISPSAELIALALAAKDHLRALLEGTADSEDPNGLFLQDRLKAVVVPTQAAQVSTPSEPVSDGDGPQTWRIHMELPPACMNTGTNPLLLLDELRELGDCTVIAHCGDVPLLDSLDPSRLYMSWEVVLTTEQPRGNIEDVFIFVRDEMALTIEPVERAADKRLGEILVERGEATQSAITQALAARPPLGELLVESGAVPVARVEAALAEQAHARAQQPPAARQAGQESIRVSADRLDELMDRVGELVISQARLKQLVAAHDDISLKAVTEEIERLIAELRDTTMGIRMVPVASLFNRFRRLVHDLSKDLGKEVEFVTSGEETELDKTVIERLNDPLVHMVRNSIDHGLETPDEREAAGKPRQGKVHLSASHAGAQVLISIHDDGHGLDAERIRARAVENGLIEADAQMSAAELYQLIFAPGFSTAHEITSVSGRGVGMDVVRRTIESLRGTVEVDSSPVSGTVVTLRLPLTLAIIDGLLVRVGDGCYVLPLSVVEECVELTAADDARSNGRNFLNIRGDLVPFLRLRVLFQSPLPPAPYQKVVIVSEGDQRVGLVVDEVIGDHQTVIKSLSQLHEDVEWFSGATILGDGGVALILDIAHLIELGQSSEDSHRGAA
ncbi:MAG TPA: chemotaxis protein CheA [Magnetospirillum sp.]|nr:chemotaxis protein CheA [Magnetospirillum sp.]